jgi:hypothetical protein
MTEPEFVVADLSAHRAPLLALNVEYMSCVFEQIDASFGVSCADMVGMPASAYVETVIWRFMERSLSGFGEHPTRREQP